MPIQSYIKYANVTRNDLIMMSLQNNGKMRTSAESNKICHSKCLLSKNVIFIEFEPLCRKLWAFMSSFTMTTHQIWSCHMTLASTFENCYVSPNSVLNFRKSYQIGGDWLKNKKLRHKAKLGVENTPLPQCL